MNKKVTLNSLSERLADSCGISAAEAEKFIKSYFDLIADTIASGESVKVKGLGTFKAVGIEARESVDVSTGNRMVIPGHRRASFTPEKSLAEKVNTPFAAFEAVELSADVSEEDLEAAVASELPSERLQESSDNVVADIPEKNEKTEESSEKETEHNATENAADVEEIIREVADEASVTDSASETVPELSVVPTPEEESVVENEIDPIPDQQTVQVVSEQEEKPKEEAKPAAPSPKDEDDYYHDDVVYEEHYHHPKKSRFLSGFFIGIACMFAVLAGLWCWYRFAPASFDSILGRPDSSEMPADASDAKIVKQVVDTPKKPTVAKSEEESVSKEETTAAAEEVNSVENKAEVPTEPSDNSASESKTPKQDEPVYDVITKSRFLTTMARDHYGSYHLWPYIYMENSKILGHPDRIKPGTRIVIPPAEKYGIDAKDKNCIAKAKKLGVEIYAKYK